MVGAIALAVALGTAGAAEVQTGAPAQSSVQQPRFITTSRPAVAETGPEISTTAQDTEPELFETTAGVTPTEDAGASLRPWQRNVVGLWQQMKATNAGADLQPNTAIPTPTSGVPPQTTLQQVVVPATAAAVLAPQIVPNGVPEKIQHSVVGLWELATQPDVPAPPPLHQSAVDAATASAPNSITAESTGRDLGSAARRSSLVQQLAFADNGELTDPIGAEAATDDARLVAYLQERPGEPGELDVDSNQEMMSEPAAPGGARQNSAAEGDSLAGAERLGEAPVDRSLDFLRTETVLLEPGESQCDVGINYLLTENEFPILLTDGMGNIVAVDEVDFRIRELTVPLEYRMGLLPRVQGFVGAPIGWSNTQVALDAFDAFQNDGGFGDIDFGLTAQFAEASANCPYVIGTLAATAPTGGDPFTGALSLAPTAPSLGQGFWSIAGNLLFIQPYDPVVIFYGIGTEHFISRHYVGVEIEPGAQYNYQLGVGFAVNERVTLSTRFFGAYVEEIKVNGDRRFGTNVEPMTIRLSATISQPCDRLVEPFVEFGITDNAVSSFFGITWTFSPNSHRKADETKLETK